MKGEGRLELTYTSTAMCNGTSNYVTHLQFVCVQSYTVSLISKTCPCNIHRFFLKKKLKISLKKKRFFNIVTLNIHGGFTLELPRRGGSNEYP